ncbi:hypothetical protein [Lysinibacillus fusiformis]|uniref:hypothetical protein n=1 Tax=Lysinibacillus fusiformis TaxID=28031 RepID=UPI00215ABA37|nr:hypothetical protein [Lysinibacillus fusiformis]MCR8852639.1 hypothetical protein [Lysinibacillus fusiformis]
MEIARASIILSLPKIEIQLNIHAIDCGGPTAISHANRDLWLLSSVQVTICPGLVLPCA